MYGARAHRRSCVGDADSLLRLRIVSAALIIAWCNIAHFTGVSCTLRVRVSGSRRAGMIAARAHLVGDTTVGDGVVGNAVFI
jgi:hypothetical protein